MEGLRRRGLRQVLVARRETPLVRRAAAVGIAVRPMTIRSEGDLFALARIAGLVRRGRFDVLHLHTSQAHGLGAVAARLAGRRRPAVVVTRRVEHSIFRHTFLGLDRLKYAPGADRVLCVSNQVRTVLRADGLPDAMLAVVHDGVELERFRRPGRSPEAVRRDLGIPAGAFLVGTVGHLEEAKGQQHLVDALARLAERVPGARLLVVGEGEARPVLAVRAVGLGLGNRVVFTGFREDVPDLLGAMDVFAFASASEGLGSSVLEAMAAGTPVVAVAAGGVPEAVRDGREGLLVRPGDGDAIADAIAQALANVFEDPAAARARARAARRRLECEFGAERMVDATLAAYRYVLAARGRPRE